MKDFNDIGVSRRIDWPRVLHLFRIGLFGALLSFVGDMILGWGVEDETLTGIARMLSAYTSTSDGGIFAAALLGLFGITIEGLSYFGVYRLIVERAPELAHRFRAGIFGYAIFGGCGFHVPVCAMVFLAKHGLADELIGKYAAYFLLPAFALFWVFFIVLEAAQIKAFARGLTLYPKRCWAFSLPVGMAAAMLLNAFGNRPWVNAICCAWISVGNLWMFGGLLMAAKTAREGSEAGR